jgi:hypothetical protein
VAPQAERRDLEQPQADREPAVVVAFERAGGLQPVGQAQRGTRGDAGAPAQLAEGQPAVGRVEREQQRQRAVDDRVALRRPAAATPRRRLRHGRLPGGNSRSHR